MNLPHSPSPFQQHWVAEAIRLQELHGGPFDDEEEVAGARAHAHDFSSRILHRADALGERQGLHSDIQRWHGMARFTGLLLALLALAAGALAAVGVLSPVERQINILLALAALLGLPTLTLLFWLVSLVVPSGQHPGGLGQIWLWMNQRFSHQKNATILTRAFVSLLTRHRLLQPALGAISHAFWFLALLSTTLAVTGLLSARRYTFNWETTLLSPDTFVWLTTMLSKPLAFFGFDGPEPAMVRLSDGLHQLPDNVHLQWSAWLIGCLICYGVAPRLVALAGVLWQIRHQLKRLTLDTSLPGHAELRSQLDPISLPGEIDAPAPQSVSTPSLTAQNLAPAQGQAMLAIELAPDHKWPPHVEIPVDKDACAVRNLGVIDTWQQRQQAIAQLSSQPPCKLLIACDGMQTPDRGTIMLIKQLVSLAHTTHIMLSISPSPDASASHNRIPVWHRSLTEAGIPPAHIHTHPEPALTWLTTAP